MWVFVPPATFTVPTGLRPVFRGYSSRWWVVHHGLPAHGDHFLFFILLKCYIIRVRAQRQVLLQHNGFQGAGLPQHNAFSRPHAGIQRRRNGDGHACQRQSAGRGQHRRADGGQRGPCRRRRPPRRNVYAGQSPCCMDCRVHQGFTKKGISLHVVYPRRHVQEHHQKACYTRCSQTVAPSPRPRSTSAGARLRTPYRCSRPTHQSAPSAVQHLDATPRLDVYLT